MNKLISLTLFVVLIFFAPLPVHAAVVESPTINSEKTIKGLSAADMGKLDRKAIEKKIGRKLKLKEKVALKIIKRKLKKTSSKHPEAAKTDGMAIAGFVLGILGLLLPGLGILALIFSLIGLKNIKRDPEHRTGENLAKVGIILGIVGIIIWIIVIRAILYG